MNKDLRRLASWWELLHPREVSGVHPHYVALELTNACNLRCRGCFTPGMLRRAGVMPYEGACKVIDDLAARGFYGVLVLEGGEPLLNRRTVEIVRYAAGRGITTSLITNGSFLTPARTEALVDAGLDILAVSVRAISREGFRRNAEADDFDRVVGNALQAARIVARRHLDGHLRPFFQVSTFEGQVEGAELAAWHDFFGRFPIDNLCWYEHFNWGGNVDPMRPLPETGRRCNYPWRNVWVKWDGAVSPCYFDTEGRLRAGNVFAEPFWDVYNAEGFRSFRRQILDDAVPAGTMCRVCNVKDLERMQEYGSARSLFRDLGQYALFRLGMMSENSARIRRRVRVDYRTPAYRARVACLEETLPRWPQVLREIQDRHGLAVAPPRESPAQEVAVA